jgi:hypothetical protein
VAVVVQGGKIMNEFYNSLCARNDIKAFLISVSGVLRRSGGVIMLN